MRDLEIEIDKIGNAGDFYYYKPAETDANGDYRGEPIRCNADDEREWEELEFDYIVSDEDVCRNHGYSYYSYDLYLLWKEIQLKEERDPNPFLEIHRRRAKPRQRVTGQNKKKEEPIDLSRIL